MFPQIEQALAWWSQQQEALRQQQALRAQQPAAPPQQAPGMLDVLRELPYAQTGPATRVDNLDAAGNPAIMQPNAMGPMPAAAPPQPMPSPLYGQNAYDTRDRWQRIEPEIAQVLGGWNSLHPEQRQQIIDQNRAAIQGQGRGTVGIDMGKIPDRGQAPPDPYTNSDPTRQAEVAASRRAAEVPYAQRLADRERNAQARGMGVTPEYIQASQKPADQRTPEDWAIINMQLGGPAGAFQNQKTDLLTALATAFKEAPAGVTVDVIKAMAEELRSAAGVQSPKPSATPVAKKPGSKPTMWGSTSARRRKPVEKPKPKAPNPVPNLAAPLISDPTSSFGMWGAVGF